MTANPNHCVFCDKEKNKNEIIEGINGDICKDCLSVIQSAHNPDTNNETVKINQEITTMSDLKNEVDKYVMGQDEAKKQLIVELYKHYGKNEMQGNNVFLVGDSGVGKTYLVRTLAKILDVPFLEVDITGFSETGYKGKDITDMLDELIIQHDGDIEAIESAIVFIDEIDKMTTTTSSAEQSTKVQHALLKIVEGTEYNYQIPDGARVLTGSIDTSKIMFVAAGACVGLSDIRKNRISPKKSIGFGSPIVKQEELLGSNGEYLGEDLIEFGFIPEFVGRFPLVIELHSLSKENIIDILTIHPRSTLGQAKKLFKKEGIELIVTEDDVDWLAEETIKHPLGVRSISHVLTRTLNNQLFDSILEGKKAIHLKEAFKIPAKIQVEKITKEL